MATSQTFVSKSSVEHDELLQQLHLFDVKYEPVDYEDHYSKEELLDYMSDEEYWHHVNSD